MSDTGGALGCAKIAAGCVGLLFAFCRPGALIKPGLFIQAGSGSIPVALFGFSFTAVPQQMEVVCCLPAHPMCWDCPSPSEVSCPIPQPFQEHTSTLPKAGAPSSVFSLPRCFFSRLVWPTQACAISLFLGMLVEHHTLIQVGPRWWDREPCATGVRLSIGHLLTYTSP